MRRKGQQAENDKTERVTGVGRRTREEIAKWNQMTALRFQTYIPEISDIPGLPSGGTDQKQFFFKKGFLPLCNRELNTAIWGLPSMGQSGGRVQGLYLMTVL